MLGVLLMTLAGGLGFADDLGARAGAVLETYCVRCHGPESESPKAVRYWADARDLPATLEEGLVFAGEPDDSDLWLVMEDGSMPPADEPEGAVPAEDLLLVKRWIAAGAPLEAGPEIESESEPDENQPIAAPPVAQQAGEADSEPESEVDPGSPLGRLHPLVVHFPIALLIVALLAEVMSLLRMGQHRSTVRFCLWTGVLGAFAASWLGWSLGDLQPRSGSSGRLMERHRWYAVASLSVAALSLVAAEIRARSEAPGFAARLAPLFLLVGAFLVSWTGHLGGKLSYGVDWLDATLPHQAESALDWLDERLP